MVAQGIRSVASKDAYAVGENFVVYSTIDAWPANTLQKPPLIYCHGATGTALKSADSLFESYVFKNLAENYVVVVGDWGGDAFGNDIAMGHINAALAYIRANYNASNDPPVIMGSSMGGCTALNYALDNDVTAVAAIIPLTDLTKAWEENTLGLTSVINAAYGGVYDPVTEGPINDPIMFAAAMDPTIPIALFVSTNDPYLPNSTAHEFCWNRPETKYKEVGAVNHGPESVFYASLEVYEFLADPNAYVGDTVPDQPSNPPTFMGAPSSGAAVGGNAFSTLSTTVNMPADIQTGEILLAEVGISGTTATANPTLTGFTPLLVFRQGMSTSSGYVAVFYRVATSSNPASTLSMGINGAHNLGYMVRRIANCGIPVLASAAGFIDSGTFTMIAPSKTTDMPASRVLTIIGGRGGSATGSAPVWGGGAVALSENITGNIAFLSDASQVLEAVGTTQHTCQITNTQGNPASVIASLILEPAA